MRIGVHLPQFRIPVSADQITAFARTAEQAGIDDVWVSDHVALPPGSVRPPTVFLDGLTVLTWAAAATRTAGLGTSVLVAPYRPAVVLAKTLASLDALSGGRVIAGIASGWMQSEFDAVGAPFAARGADTDDAITTCRALWAGQTAFPRRGERITDVALAPPPARPGGPPVWVGGNSDRAIRRAVRLGDGWHTTISDPDRLAARLRVLDGALTAAGRPRATLTVSVRVRADAERFAAQAPHLARLGVDHVLIDHPDVLPGDLRHELSRVRAAAG